MRDWLQGGRAYGPMVRAAERLATAAGRAVRIRMDDGSTLDVHPIRPSWLGTILPAIASALLALLLA